MSVILVKPSDIKTNCIILSATILNDNYMRSKRHQIQQMYTYKVDDLRAKIP